MNIASPCPTLRTVTRRSPVFDAEYEMKIKDRDRNISKERAR
jgi:hypothetical protein